LKTGQKKNKKHIYIRFFEQTMKSGTHLTRNDQNHIYIIFLIKPWKLVQFDLKLALHYIFWNNLENKSNLTSKHFYSEFCPKINNWKRECYLCGTWGWGRGRGRRW
jgi:hypothetical protein